MSSLDGEWSIVDIPCSIVQANVDEYEPAADTDEFVSAVQALAERTDAEGEPGVLRYQFYVDPEDHRAIATIVYRDADAWLEHHRRSSGATRSRPASAGWIDADPGRSGGVIRTRCRTRALRRAQGHAVPLQHLE